jgi:hypothetical protein
MMKKKNEQKTSKQSPHNNKPFSEINNSGWERTFILVATGILTILTGVNQLLTYPATAFLLYTFLARIAEIACVNSLQSNNEESHSESHRDRLMDHKHHLITQQCKKNRRNKNVDSLKDDSQDEGLEADDISPLSPTMIEQKDTDAEEISSARSWITDRIFGTPRLPLWIQQWTERGDDTRRRSLPRSHKRGRRYRAQAYLNELAEEKERGNVGDEVEDISLSSLSVDSSLSFQQVRGR